MYNLRDQVKVYGHLQKSIKKELIDHYNTKEH